jgi:uncharacterized membrane protein
MIPSPAENSRRPISRALKRGTKLLRGQKLLKSRRLSAQLPIEVERSITVRQPPEVLYAYFRDPRHLRTIMGSFIDVSGEGAHLHWTLDGPLGKKLTWETTFVEERPGELLRWQSAVGGPLQTEGCLTLGPVLRDRGTVVKLRFRFEPPVGLARAAAHLLHAIPEVAAMATLRRFKSLAETGEIPTTEKNPAGRNGGRGR